MRKTGLQSPAGKVSLLGFSEMRLGASVDGRLEGDGETFGTNGSLSGFDDTFDPRRARITVKRTSLLVVSLGYQIEFGYVSDSFTVCEAYVAIVDVRHLYCRCLRGHRLRR